MVTTIGNGINLQPSYYSNVNFGWELMRQYPAIKTVRIEIEPDKAAQAVRWISEARNEGYQVIATYHKHTVLGTNDAAELITAANWWKANCDSFGAGVIINLFNEWGNHNISAANYAKAYNAALLILRTFYTGPVVIDLPGWGQETHTAYAAIKTATTRITDPDIILSAHVYRNSWNSATGQHLNKNDLDKLASCGRTCIIAEFGDAGDQNGQCDWAACVDHAKSKGWPVIGWCWNGDGEQSNMVSPAWKDDPGARQFTKSPFFNTIYGKLGGQSEV